MDEIKPRAESNDVAPADPAAVTPSQTAANPAAPRRLLKRPKPKSNSLSIWLALPVVFLLGLGSGWLLWGQTSDTTQVTVKDDVKRYTVPTGDNPSQGPENAPITIVEFSDYQCPYCVRWYKEVYTRLMKDYAGKIRFVYRDFPLYSIHPEAQSAAEAADCAGEQDAYWLYHDALFGQKSGLGTQAYTQYASELGLNIDQFNNCVSEHRFKTEVDADFEFATSLGVSSTPTFFVNGLAVIGAQPFEVFQQIIDKELAGEIPK